MLQTTRMKVLVLTTFAHTGGAAIAAQRLVHALRGSGVETTVLSRRNISLPFWKEKWGGVPFLMERLRIFLANGMSRRNLFAVDTACCGDDVTRTAEYKEADVIHLHWINQGFISLNVLRKILRSGKRVVWTMHDQWATTGVCHYSDGCLRYETGCHHCPLLPGKGGNDLAATAFRKKQELYAEGAITFVACSEWLAGIARRSALGRGQEILSIPNAIDTAVFKPMERKAARELLGLKRDAVLILFGCQKVTDKRKGLDYLIEAVRELPGIGVVLVGGSAAETEPLMPQGVEVTCIGQVSDTARMAMLYAAVDAFVTPSLQDNLPNTIMEAMACGTPCVGFNVGGIPEMIDHRVNGYVASYKDARSLAEGIRYVTAEANAPRLAEAAREKVMRCYSEKAVAERYMEVYRKKG